MKADFVSLKWPWQAMIPFKNVCIDSYIVFLFEKKPTILFLVSDLNHANLSKGKKKTQEDCT